MNADPTSAPSARFAQRGIARWAIALVGCLLLLAGVLTIQRVRNRHIEALLLTTLPSEIPRDASLVDFANAQGASLFGAHCASCHGVDLKGGASTGAPNLTNGVWLFGEGDIFDIERTILFGIRTGSGKSRDVTEMPAFGQRGLLTDVQIRQVVQYVLKLNGRPHLEEDAAEGRKVFEVGSYACSACHEEDGRGDRDSGASDLTANVWNYGGDEKALYDSIYFGRRGVCPGWFGVLSLGQIRALAVYVYSASHPAG